MNFERLSERIYLLKQEEKAKIKRAEKEKKKERKREAALRKQDREEAATLSKEERQKRVALRKEQEFQLRSRLTDIIVEDFKEYFDLDKGKSYIYSWGNTDKYFGYIKKDIDKLSEYWSLLKQYNEFDQYALLPMIREKLPEAKNHLTGESLWKVDLCYDNFGNDSLVTGIEINIDESGYHISTS